MLIGNRKLLKRHSTLELNVNTQKLKQVHQSKYLGIIVDEELNWNAQCDNVCKRVSRMISFMGRLRHIINEQNMNLISPLYCHNWITRTLCGTPAKINKQISSKNFNIEQGDNFFKINPYSRTSNEKYKRYLGGIFLFLGVQNIFYS